MKILKVRSIAAVIIMAAIAAATFSGCGESADEKQESPASTSSAVVEKEESEESTAESSSVASEEESKAESSLEEKSAVESAAESSVADESQVEPSQESSEETSTVASDQNTYTTKNIIQYGRITTPTSIYYGEREYLIYVDSIVGILQIDDDNVQIFFNGISYKLPFEYIELLPIDYIPSNEDYVFLYDPRFYSED